METLAFRTDQYTLSEASENIGEVLAGVAGNLPRHGFAGVKNEGHVYGTKAGCGVDLFYLFVGNRTFWQVATGHGPDRATVDRTLEEVKQVVKDLHFL